MLAYVARRIGLAIPLLWALATVVFVMMRVVPGDPAIAALGEHASRDAIEAMRERMGLDAPLWSQYVQFIGNLLRGDLGVSLVSRVSVAAQVLYALPYTLLLTAASVVIGVILGIPLGVVSAIHRNSALDYITRTVSLAGMSVPAFYLGILLILGFSVTWRWFPVMGGGDLSKPLDALYHLVLPSLSLGMIMTASIARLGRSTMLNILGEDYIRTAKAKGIRQQRVNYLHGLRNALIPLLSLLSVNVIMLLGSSVMTEIVFSRPGLGSLLIRSANQRDYTTVQSVLVIYGVWVILLNLLTDLTYGLVDPRVKYE